MKTISQQISFASLCAAWAGAAQAAGGHYAVDDAAILEQDQCQVESWYERQSKNQRQLFHLGPACRVGAVEIGLNIDQNRPSNASRTSILGPQIKWARALNDSFSIGLTASTNWQRHSPHRLGSSLVIPLSVQLSAQWLAHVNIGRDFQAQGPSQSHSGAALEWAASPSWTLIGERFRDSAANHERLGGRWSLNDQLSLDLSRAKTLGDPSAAWWTLGLNFVFAP